MAERRATEDQIELLREQIRAATDAAERLVRQAIPPPQRTDAAAQPPSRFDPSAGSEPPSGSQPPSGSGPPPPEPPPPEPPPPEPPPPPPPPRAGAGAPPGSGPPPGPVPPSGWDTPSAHREAGEELQALRTLFATLRDLLPADIQEQVTELIRQLLLLLRALIDWAVSRIEGGPRGRDVHVEDIPIA